MNRECIRLQTYNRVHKSDREIRLTEMAGTIRVLSARSDIHSQLVGARQELESERLCSNHLRLDIDSYRAMLETEQRNTSTLQRQLDNLQGHLDSMSVLKTIFEIPGVPSDTLIEIFSGKLVASLSEAAKAKMEVAQLSANLKASKSAQSSSNATSTTKAQQHTTTPVHNLLSSKQMNTKGSIHSTFSPNKFGTGKDNDQDNPLSVSLLFNLFLIYIKLFIYIYMHIYYY